MLYKRELLRRQEEIYEIIKSQYGVRCGYRRIVKRLLDRNIETAIENVIKNNKVFAVIKRNEERQVR